MKSNIPTLIALSIINAFGILFVYTLFEDGIWFLGGALTFVTLLINIIFLRKDTKPLRWLTPGFALIILLALYPILFTLYTAFTNYSDGHLLSKQQTIDLLSKEQFISDESPTFEWHAYRTEDGKFALLLFDPDGNYFFAEQNTEIIPFIQTIQDNIDGYQLVPQKDTIKYLSTLEKIVFGLEPNTVNIISLKKAAQAERKYTYDPSQDAIIDNEAGFVYQADNELGQFVNKNGEALRPGYQVTIGFDNFTRLLNSPALRGPFIQVFLWTIIFAFLSVLTTFSLGLFMALLLDGPGIPFKKVFRSILILPYALPGVIGILIWRGLLNPHLGIISTTLQQLFGSSPSWFSDPNWAKFAILMINLWLGYPYMMLVCSGALQSIPKDIYEAAEVDGANIFQKFWHITLPMLLVSVGPLLVSSFTFNFNNFNVIYLFNEGGPPIPSTPTPAGHTDILISYTYRLAFAGERGSDYGYAAAITFIIFIVLAVITILNFRYTRIWEEVSENV
jgi:ABC-type sugar transport system permease subunit